MKAFRMSIKQLLIGVCICGLFFWGIFLGDRSRTFRILARFHTIKAESEAIGYEVLEGNIKEYRDRLLSSEDHLGRLSSSEGRTPASRNASSDASHWRAEMFLNKMLIANNQPKLESISARRRYHEQLARKYRRAAWRPWLSVAPDPRWWPRMLEWVP